MRFRNNIVQDTIKVIKLSSFLFKIFWTFWRLHSTDLFGDDNDYDAVSRQLLTVLALINSICLAETAKLSSGDEDEETKRFYAIKIDFVKEYASNYEALLQQALAEPKFLASLTKIDRIDDDAVTVDEFTIFFSICINKSVDFEYESIMGRSMKLLGSSQVAIFTPVCNLNSLF